MSRTLKALAIIVVFTIGISANTNIEVTNGLYPFVLSSGEMVFSNTVEDIPDGGMRPFYWSGKEQDSPHLVSNTESGANRVQFAKAGETTLVLFGVTEARIRFKNSQGWSGRDVVVEKDCRNFTVKAVGNEFWIALKVIQEDGPWPQIKVTKIPAEKIEDKGSWKEEVVGIGTRPKIVEGGKVLYCRWMGDGLLHLLCWEQGETEDLGPVSIWDDFLAITEFDAEEGFVAKKSNGRIILMKEGEIYAFIALQEEVLDLSLEVVEGTPIVSYTGVTYGNNPFSRVYVWVYGEDPLEIGEGYSTFVTEMDSGEARLYYNHQRVIYYSQVFPVQKNVYLPMVAR